MTSVTFKYKLDDQLLDDMPVYATFYQMLPEGSTDVRSITSETADFKGRVRVKYADDTEVEYVADDPAIRGILDHPEVAINFVQKNSPEVAERMTELRQIAYDMVAEHIPTGYGHRSTYIKKMNEHLTNMSIAINSYQYDEIDDLGAEFSMEVAEAFVAMMKRLEFPNGEIGTSEVMHYILTGTL